MNVSIREMKLAMLLEAHRLACHATGQFDAALYQLDLTPEQRIQAENGMAKSKATSERARDEITKLLTPQD